MTKEYCEYKNLNWLLGNTLLTSTEVHEYVIANLFTSLEESENKDSDESILLYTVLAVKDLLENYKGHEFYSVKINSGHFGVPWEKTEFIIKTLAEKYQVTWNICDPNLGEN
jgi:ADP-ribose 1''-phosphate phosphatase